MELTALAVRRPTEYRITIVELEGLQVLGATMEDARRNLGRELQRRFSAVSEIELSQAFMSLERIELED